MAKNIPSVLCPYGIGIELTPEERNWFGNRMTESHTGRVIVPSYLVKKFRKLADDEFLSSEAIKGYLIDKCY